MKKAILLAIAIALVIVSVYYLTRPKGIDSTVVTGVRSIVDKVKE